MPALVRALLLIGVVLALVAGCSPPEPAPRSAVIDEPVATPSPTRAPQLTATAASAPAGRTATAIVPDSGWRSLRTGLERRVINLRDADGGVKESIYLLRIDPDHFRLDVAYKPGEPQSLPQWQLETGALVVVNAGFFTADYEATGLLIADGVASGTSYRDFGGMLAISGGQATLRWLPQQPYDPAESLSAAVQSFPMLVRPSGQDAYDREDGLADRRTVIGQDGQGRMLLILATRGAFTLAEMSRFLLASDLELEAALNLDGGASSGLILADPAEGIPAFSLLPAVITVYPRQAVD